jgi:transcriptional antiterminator RfaH
MTHHWYALQTHARKEEALWNELEARDFEVYYPHMRVKPVNPRSRTVRPYFPGYLFVRADLEVVGISALRWMPHTRGLVCFGGEPAPVPDALVYALRRKLESTPFERPDLLPGVVPGDVVQIDAGPFEGYMAVFDARLPGTERVRVLLKMLNDRQLSVELVANQVRMVKKNG